MLGNANETRYVMGCLSQLEDDRYFLEDLTGQIQVDVSHAATTSGLYTENCIVVAEGEVRKDGVFEAGLCTNQPSYFSSFNFKAVCRQLSQNPLKL